MTTKPQSKINFVIDEDVLTHARVFAVKNNVSLNALVASFFKGLGQTPIENIDEKSRILAEVSVGKRSFADATAELKLDDIGLILPLLRERGLPLPLLPEEIIDAQVSSHKKLFLSAIAKTAPAAQIAKPRKGSA
jgi:hypothetical protein